MIFKDNDFDHFATNYPFYIKIFEKYDRLLKNYDAELLIRIRDSTVSDRIIFENVMRSGDSIPEKNQLIQELLNELNNEINNTCNRCGGSPAKYRNEYLKSLEENQLVICDKCYLRIDDVEIRYINCFDEFDYAKFGSYFFEGEDLYVLTDKNAYKQYDIKRKFLNSAYEQYVIPNKYIIKAIFAGQDTGFLDDCNKSIYTGDIVLTEGFYNRERDPYVFEHKVRNTLTGKNEFIYKVCGVVASNSFFNSAPHRNVYEVVLDNHGAFLIHSLKIEVIGNIFYNLRRSEKINIWQKAAAIAQSGYFENGFWRLHSKETVKDDLKKIKTPSFVSFSKLLIIYIKAFFSKTFKVIKITLAIFIIISIIHLLFFFVFTLIGSLFTSSFTHLITNRTWFIF